MNCCGALFWAVVLCTVAFPVALFCAFIYILLHTLSGCCPGCEGFSETFLKGVQLPGTAVRKIVHCEC